jgi:predicted RNase H-like HicB family nuclease
MHHIFSAIHRRLAPAKFLQERERYLAALPRKFEAVIEKDADGYFYSTIPTCNDIMTFAKTETELQHMTLDAFLTYYGVPRAIAKDLTVEFN